MKTAPLPTIGTDTRYPRIRVDRGDQLPANAPYVLRFERLMERAFLAAFAQAGGRL